MGALNPELITGLKPMLGWAKMLVLTMEKRMNQ